ncbi:TetR/AcrR family transcriptional regulator [Mycolicibacterium fluoranthenivorans]|uniref:TetR/AcrR family transcriptional regulator n=1 Tax=Mycolicibacterium fluoranthenivorans TaxID=258505 RepID=A0A7G8P8E6_9MYCO|nr:MULTISPECIES: TetR/AcrR family transcriptional regulator [Mycobacteriaceae]MCV7256204.1 TetR/AcrR family transcriptional regulator [Mycobacterium hackensackense]QNJ90612.1 TetR/AcrR family transcriptional regulator [Mycolicibacterium fluoranthenivorans]
MILSSAERKGDARDRLLTRLLDAFGDGLPSPELSLREVATRAETSHALLRYHFGSLAGVLAAMLTVQRSRDNEALLKTAQRGTFDDFVMAIWRAYSSPAQRSRVRGFFHVVGLAAYSPGDFGEFIDSLDDLTRVLAALAESEGREAKEALSISTVVIAALRGLLLQEVLTPGVHSQDAVAAILRMINISGAVVK